MPLSNAKAPLTHFSHPLAPNPLENVPLMQL
jgi:hypothetical protein